MTKAKKTTKPATVPRNELVNIINKLRAENKTLRKANDTLAKRIAELEQRPTLGEVYSGAEPEPAPRMPWETSLPNSFEAES